MLHVSSLSCLQSKSVLTIKDSITFTIHQTDLTEIKVGESFKTKPSNVPYSNGLKWWIKWYPAGFSSNESEFTSVYAYVNQYVSAVFSFKIGNHAMAPNFSVDFLDGYGLKIQKFMSHEALQPLFVDGKALITCTTDFTFSVPVFIQTPHLSFNNISLPTDFKLVVGSKQLSVHRSLLWLISTVFRDMLTLNIEKNKPGQFELSGFDFETVEAAIDFCYDRLKPMSVETLMNVLRFANKYSIKSITNQLDKIPRFNLSVDTFPTTLLYAYDVFDHKLFHACCVFFQSHQKLIRAKKSFTTLPPSVVAGLLQQVFGLKTELEILRHAGENAFDYMLEPLEKSVFESLSVETFCDVTRYAWDCSRDDLKNACAKFLNDNLLEIKKLKAFIDLPSEMVHGVMKLGLEILLPKQ